MHNLHFEDQTEFILNCWNNSVSTEVTDGACGGFKKVCNWVCVCFMWTSHLSYEQKQAQQDACEHTHQHYSHDAIKKDLPSHSPVIMAHMLDHHHIILSPNQSSLPENISKPRDLQCYQVYGNDFGFFHMCHWCGFSVNTLKGPTNNH